MKALSLPIQKLCPMLKFLKSRSKVKVKVTRSKILVSMERYCHKEYTCEIWKLYHLPIKSYAQCKVFRTNRQTDRPKTICPRIFDSGSIKNKDFSVLPLFILNYTEIYEWELLNSIDFILIHVTYSQNRVNPINTDKLLADNINSSELCRNWANLFSKQQCTVYQTSWPSEATWTNYFR